MSQIIFYDLNLFQKNFIAQSAFVQDYVTLFHLNYSLLENPNVYSKSIYINFAYCFLLHPSKSEELIAQSLSINFPQHFDRFDTPSEPGLLPCLLNLPC